MNTNQGSLNEGITFMVVFFGQKVLHLSQSPYSTRSSPRFGRMWKIGEFYHLVKGITSLLSLHRRHEKSQGLWLYQFKPWIVEALCLVEGLQSIFTTQHHCSGLGPFFWVISGVLEASNSFCHSQLCSNTHLY